MDPSFERFLDYVVPVASLIGGLCLLAVLAWVASIPGRVARKRNHPSAQTIARLGWLSVLFLPLLPVLLIWARQRPIVHVKSSIRVPVSRLHARDALGVADSAAH